MAAAAATATATATASSSAPPARIELTDQQKQYNRIILTTSVISLALFIIINVLGTYGVLQGQDASLILGSTMIGGTVLSGAILYYGVPSARKTVIIQAIIPIALGILGITGTLNATQLGIAFLLLAAAHQTFSIFRNNADLVKALRAGNKIACGFTLITIALLTINALGATGVLTGDAARIGIALGNVAGISALVAIRHKFMRNANDPNRKLELLALIPAAVLGGMGVYGTLNPFVLGTGFLIASSLQGRTLHFAGIMRPYTPPRPSNNNNASQPPPPTDQRS